MKQIDGIFQVAVSIFNTPAKMIKLSKSFGWKPVARQVGDKAFVRTIGQLKTNKSELNGIRIGRAIVQRIKMTAIYFNITIIMTMCLWDIENKDSTDIDVQIAINRQM